MIKAAPKAKTKTKRTAGGPVDSTQLKSYVDRLDNLAEEGDALKDDRKEVLDQAKSAGFSPKALRKIIAEKRRKTDAELEADLEVYRAALGMPGATLRSVADAHGITKSKLHRLVPNRSSGTEGDGGSAIITPHDADGVITEINPESGATGTAKLAEQVAPNEVTPVPEGGEGTGTNSGTEARAALRGEEAHDPVPDAPPPTIACIEAPATPSVGAVAEGESPQRVAVTDEPDTFETWKASNPTPGAMALVEAIADDLDACMPDFLRRRPHQVNA